MIRVTVWDENIQNENEKMKAVYPQGIRTVLAEALKNNPELDVRVAHAQMPAFGLPDDVLEETDVLIWWAHKTHDTLPDLLAEKIKQQVLRGMGFIPLHSAHLSKPFLLLMGTSGTLKYRYVDYERIWTTCPMHPIAKDVPEVFELEIEEAYGEYFDIPKPDDVVFTSWFEGGSVFRGGCTWTRGMGKVFYFHVGHDTYPTFYNKNIQKIIENAVFWTAPQMGKRSLLCEEEPAWVRP
ncbi:MAG: ThuA domain-containing protein [Eubacterium sp.]|nr:ThuA domain-containing protein [Eubacterium sp.]